jgi:hypothetical protein
VTYECVIGVKRYEVTISPHWEGDLREPHIDGNRFFPSVAVALEEASILERTVMGICKTSGCEDWAVRILLVLSREKPVITAYRLNLDWISQ